MMLANNDLAALTLSIKIIGTTMRKTFSAIPYTCLKPLECYFIVFVFITLSGIVSAANWNSATNQFWRDKPSPVVKPASNALVTRYISNSLNRQPTASEVCEILQVADIPSLFLTYPVIANECRRTNKPLTNKLFISDDDRIDRLTKLREKLAITFPKFNLSHFQYPNPDTFLQAVKLSLVQEQTLSLQPNLFCSEWLFDLAYVDRNQTKNMDGTIGWSNGTERDAFVFCQDFFPKIAIQSLQDQTALKKLERIIWNYVQRDTPARYLSSESGENFTYTMLIARVFQAYEVTHDLLPWNAEQHTKFGVWARKRAYELYPIDLEKNTIVCPRLADKTGDNNCQNMAALTAQAALRAALFSKDDDLAKMSYLTFAQVMTGFRKDGSNVYDSNRTCVAADYQIWGTQFLVDFTYLWSKIAEPIWNTTFLERGTPKQISQYSLKIIGDPRLINHYTRGKNNYASDCESNYKNRKQKVKDYYPKSHILIGTGSNRREVIAQILSEPYPSQDFLFFGSGINSDWFVISESLDKQVEESGSFAKTKIDLIKYLWPSGEQVPHAISSLLAIEKKFEIDNEAQMNEKKIKEAGDFVTALASLGLIVSRDQYQTAPEFKYDLGAYKLDEVVNPGLTRIPKKYRIRFSDGVRENNGKKFVKGLVTFFHSDKALYLGHSIRRNLRKDIHMHSNWIEIGKKCGYANTKNDMYFEIPITRSNSRQNMWARCAYPLIKNRNLSSTIRTLTHIGMTIDPSNFPFPED